MGVYVPIRYEFNPPIDLLQLITNLHPGDCDILEGEFVECVAPNKYLLDGLKCPRSCADIVDLIWKRNRMRCRKLVRHHKIKYPSARNLYPYYAPIRNFLPFTSEVLQK